MKLIVCVIISLALGSFGFKVDSVAVDMVQKLETENHHKTEFADLDEDCVFLILEHLDFVNLLKVAQINGEFSTLAADVYRRKYSELTVVIKYDFISMLEQIELLEDLLGYGKKIGTDLIERIGRDQSFRFQTVPDIHEHDNEIKFEDCYGIFNMFKYFGHEMKRILIEGYSDEDIDISTLTDQELGRYTDIDTDTDLDIDAYAESSTSKYEPWKTAFIALLIREFSSESLVDVYFRFEAEKLLNHLKKPLINVENVSFDCKLPYPNTPFNELFPAVRHLYIRDMHDDFDAIDCHMPHLEHVQMYKYIVVPNFISKNPQIRSIDVGRVKPAFLQKLNTLLPQLETLKLNNVEQTAERIQFENVTTFEFSPYNDNSPPFNLHLLRLQNLHIFSGTNLNVDKCLEFLNKHNHLSHLQLKAYNINDSQFQELTANLKDLAKLTLTHEDNEDDSQELSTKAVEEFLRSHHKVEQLNVINFAERWIAELRERLKHDWSMTSMDNGLSFERI